MDEDGNLKNGIRIEMDYFNFVVVKESAEEIAGGKHHNLVHIGCWDVFPGGKMPLQHGAVWDKVVCNKFANLAFICDGRLK
jgi:hypothetical protein